MHIDSLSLCNFRSHESRKFQFDPRVTIMSGPNASGKTSVLEAVHALGRGKSFRDGDADLLQFGKPWWRVDGSFGGRQREIRYVPKKDSTPARKEIVIDGVKRGRFSHNFAIPMVLFQPDDLLLIHGSPSRRRRYMDGFIASISPVYGQVLRKYERSVLQRNNLLKRGGTIDDTLFVWDVTLAELAAKIIATRLEIINSLSPRLGGAYREIAACNESCELLYKPASDYRTDNLQQHMLGLLSARHDRDKLLGYTSVGPHRDDIDFYLRGRQALTTASRGESRTIILALKLAEIDLVQHTLDQTPIILLDDVFSELDESRRTSLVRDLSVENQIIITTTSADVVPLGGLEVQQIELK